VTVPRLHLVTDDRVLAAPGFDERATALLEAHGPALALHLRGHGTRGRELFALAAALAGRAATTGSVLLVNDRVDVALAAGCGAQVGRRSIPVPCARTLLGAGAVLGYSAHGSREARAAVDDGADVILLGTIWPTPSHSGVSGAGLELVAEVAASLAAPVIAIGGVTPARAREAVEAGAHGVAVLGGVWDAAEPVSAAARYLEYMGGEE
jgi:thiamine-phosphate pyrophosphorylase